MFLQPPFFFNTFSSLWMVLILLYWVLKVPQHVNVGVAWFIGFILDVIYNSVIGTHILALILIVSIAIKFRNKMLFLDYWVMPLVILCLIIVYQLLLFLLQSYVGDRFNFWSILGGTAISTLIWPFLFFLLSNYQKKLRI